MSTATNTVGNARETSSKEIITSARPNPIAAEIPVNASGTRPKSGGTERELFSEDTETVLTFEDGAVIRLLAPVTPGQLIFLTNLVTNQEVVCEVLRKRLLRPAGCYVELQFTEHKKGFWDTPQAGQGQTAATKRAETVDSSKKSLETLVSEVKELLAKKPAPERNAAAETTPTDQVEGKAAEAESDDASDDLLPKPELDFSQVPSAARAKQADPRLLQKPIPVVGATTRKLAWALMAVVLLGVGARYGHWVDFAPRPKAEAVKPSGQPESVPQTESTQVGAKDAATKRGAGEETTAARNGTAAAAPATGAIAEKSALEAGKVHAESAEPPTAPGNESAAETAKAQPGTKANERRGKSETSATVQAKVPAKAAEPKGEGPLVPAKLLKSVNPVYPPDAMRGFITGDVKAEVEVEPTGHAGDVKVLSGPTQLREAAMEAVKKYQFSPATRGGKAVPSKAIVTVKFWFNP